MNQPGMGALVPPSLQWQMGKTAASIRYVATVDHFLSKAKLEPYQRAYLEKSIEDVKSGKVTKLVFVDAHDIMETLKNLKEDQ